MRLCMPLTLRKSMMPPLSSCISLPEISPTIHTLLDNIGGMDEKLVKERLTKQIDYTSARISS